MPERSVAVALTTGGVETVEVAGRLWYFTPLDRIKRAGGVFLLAVLLATLLVPIPIIHLIGPPLILLAGVLVAVRQLRATGRLAPMGIACPKCGEINRLGGGLGRPHPLTTTTQICQSCRRVLTLSVRLLE